MDDACFKKREKLTHYKDDLRLHIFIYNYIYIYSDSTDIFGFLFV